MKLFSLYSRSYEWLLGEGLSVFFSGMNDTRCTSCTPGKDPCSEVIDQHKMDSMVILCVLCCCCYGSVVFCLLGFGFVLLFVGFM